MVRTVDQDGEEFTVLAGEPPVVGTHHDSERSDQVAHFPTQSY